MVEAHTSESIVYALRGRLQAGKVNSKQLSKIQSRVNLRLLPRFSEVGRGLVESGVLRSLGSCIGRKEDAGLSSSNVTPRILRRRPSSANLILSYLINTLRPVRLKRAFLGCVQLATTRSFNPNLTLSLHQYWPSVHLRYTY